MTHQELLDILDYSIITGQFYWKISTGRRSKIGSIAGSVGNHGYTRIIINGIKYYGHKLAWFYVNGSWPQKTIDHVNRMRSCNAYHNLREATQSEQGQNRTPVKNNSGHKGVCWDKQYKKWRVKIRLNYEQIFVGMFDNFDDAVKARQEAEIKYHPFRIKT